MIGVIKSLTLKNMFNGINKVLWCAVFVALLLNFVPHFETNFQNKYNIIKEFWNIFKSRLVILKKEAAFLGWRSLSWKKLLKAHKI